MANKVKIQRSEYIKIRVSKEEKELFYKYAENMGITPTRLARNIIMIEAESIIGRYIATPVVKAYIYFAKITNKTEILERIKEE